MSDPGWPALPQLAEAYEISPTERDALMSHISKYW